MERALRIAGDRDLGRRHRQLRTGAGTPSRVREALRLDLTGPGRTFRLCAPRSPALGRPARPSARQESWRGSTALGCTLSTIPLAALDCTTGREDLHDLRVGADRLDIAGVRASAELTLPSDHASLFSRDKAGRCRREGRGLRVNGSKSWCPPRSSASCRMPWLPISVPRSGTASKALSGVMRLPQRHGSPCDCFGGARRPVARAAFHASRRHRADHCGLANAPHASAHQPRLSARGAASPSKSFGCPPQTWNARSSTTSDLSWRSRGLNMSLGHGELTISTLEEIGYVDPESSRDSIQHQYGRVALTAFDSAQVSLVDLGSVSELLCDKPRACLSFCTPRPALSVHPSDETDTGGLCPRP